jgi:uncharacterized Zn finger protein
MRENARTKADRYLVEGRIVITAVTSRHGGSVQATARGEGAVYSLAWTPQRGWTCTCPVRTDQCAHLIALRRVTATDLEDQ